MKPGERPNHPVELLSASIDGEIRPAEAAALEAHLEGCAECRGLREDFRKLGGTISEETHPAAPADLRERILAGLTSRTTTLPVPFWKQAMPLAAAASLLMAVLLWLGRPDRLPPLRAPEPLPAPTANAPAEAERGLSKEGRTAAASSADGQREAPAPPLPAPLVSRVPTDRGAGKRAEKRSDEAGRRMESRFASGSATPVSPAPAMVGGNAAPAATDAAVPAPGAMPPAPAKETAGPHAFDRQNEGADSKKASGPEAEKEAELQRLRALGYIGSEGSAAESAAAGSAAGAEARERLQASPARTGLAGQIPEPAATMQVATPQSPGLFAPPYTVRLVADRRMLVQSGPYACTAWVDDADGRRIAAALQESERVRPPSPPPAAAEADAPATVIPATPEAREVILRLVRVSYRRALESRCGPLPN